MSDFKERLLVETNELSDKVVKLTSFIVGEVFQNIPKQQQSLLEIQLDFMGGYLNVLKERLRTLE